MEKSNYPTFYDRYGGQQAPNDLQATPALQSQAQPDQTPAPQFNPWLEMSGQGVQSQAEKPQNSFNSPWEMP